MLGFGQFLTRLSPNFHSSYSTFLYVVSTRSKSGVIYNPLEVLGIVFTLLSHWATVVSILLFCLCYNRRMCLVYFRIMMWGIPHWIWSSTEVKKTRLIKVFGKFKVDLFNETNNAVHEKKSARKSAKSSLPKISETSHKVLENNVCRLSYALLKKICHKFHVKATNLTIYCVFLTILSNCYSKRKSVQRAQLFWDLEHQTIMNGGRQKPLDWDREQFFSLHHSNMASGAGLFFSQKTHRTH